MREGLHVMPGQTVGSSKKLFGWLAAGLLVVISGCGDGGGRDFPIVDDDDGGAAAPSAPIAVITQGFGINDATGDVLRVVLNYTLQDADPGDLVDVLVEYSVRRCTDDDFTAFVTAPASILGSEGTTGLSATTTPPGQVHTFVMDAVAAGISGAGPVDLLIRITPSNDDITGATVTSGIIRVGSPPVELVLGNTTPAVSPSFGNQLPVSLRRNGLQVDEVTLVVTFNPTSAVASGTPVTLGPVATAVGAMVLGTNVSPGRIEVTIGGGGPLADGIVASLLFDVLGTASAGSIPVICVADLPTGTGTRGRFQGVRQCVGCASTNGSILLTGPAPGVAIGSSAPLGLPSTNNCIPVSLDSMGNLVDQVTMTVGYDSTQVAPSAMPVTVGPAGMLAGASVVNVDQSVVGELTFTIGAGAPIPDGVFAFVCFDVLFTATIGVVPVPCLMAEGSVGGSVQPLQCGTGGTLNIANLAAAISIGSYSTPPGTDPVTGCLFFNLGTVANPTGVPPAITNTVDLTLTTIGNSFDTLDIRINFDSNLLACPAAPPTLAMNGGVTLGADAPVGTVIGAAVCNDTAIGPGLGVISFTLTAPAATIFVDGVVATLSFDVPGPSPDVASTPSDPMNPAIATLACNMVRGTFGLTAPGIACGSNGSFQVRPPCITRRCTGLRVFSAAGVDDFTFPVTAATGPLEYDANVLGSPLVLTGIGDGAFDGTLDRGDQQVQVYATFNEPPLIERVTSSSGGPMSGGSTTYVVAAPARGAVSVSGEGLVTGAALNCCDLITVTYTPDFVSATGTPCVTDFMACVDAAGPDDINDLPDLRAGPMAVGDLDAEIPGLPSGPDLTMLGAGSTFTFVIWVNSGTLSVGAYDFRITFDGTVVNVPLTVPGSPARPAYAVLSSMDAPAAELVVNGAAMGSIRFNAVDAVGTTETGIFALVGVPFMVVQAGSSTFATEVMNLTDELAVPIGAMAQPHGTFGATATACPVTFP